MTDPNLRFGQGRTKMCTLNFMLHADIKGMSFNPANKKGLEFPVPSSDRTIRLYPNNPEDDPFGHRFGLVCRTSTTIGVSSFEFDFVEALIRGQYLAFAGMPISLPYLKHGDVQIDAAGLLRDGYKPPIDAYPRSLQSLISSTETELKNILQRFLRLLRWSAGDSAQHDNIASTSLYWQTEPDLFYHVGFAKDVQVGRSSGRGSLRWTEQLCSRLASLWASEAQEPLAHELYREAEPIRRGGPPY